MASLKKRRGDSVDQLLARLLRSRVPMTPDLRPPLDEPLPAKAVPLGDLLPNDVLAAQLHHLLADLTSVDVGFTFPLLSERRESLSRPLLEPVSGLLASEGRSSRVR